MKRRLVAAAAGGAAILIAAAAAPDGAERGAFAAAFAPALLALIVPFGLPVEREWKADLVLAPATGAAAALALAGFLWKSPGPGAAAGLGLLFAAWTVLLTGLFRAGSRRGAGVGHLAASGLGLLLCSTHLLADPLVSAIAERPGPRRALIAFVLNANPSLLGSAAFWDRDLLKSSYGYARSEIGSFHGYTYAGWGWVALIYVGLGVALWAAGRKKETEAS